MKTRSRSIFEIGNADRIVEEHANNVTIYLVRIGLNEIARKSNGTLYDPANSAIPKEYATTASTLYPSFPNVSDSDILQVHSLHNTISDVKEEEPRVA